MLYKILREWRQQNNMLYLVYFIELSIYNRFHQLTFFTMNINHFIFSLMLQVVILCYLIYNLVQILNKITIKRLFYLYFSNFLVKS